MKKINGLMILSLMVGVVFLGIGITNAVWATSASPAKKVDKAPTEVININTADLETLIKLPGIGEKRAKDILEYRKKIGSFKTSE